MNRQRRYQKRRNAEGNCAQCGKPAQGGKTVCEDCAEKRSIADHGRPRRYSRPGPDAWNAVDWTRPTKEIAAELGVSSQSVSKQRRRRGLPMLKAGRPPRDQ